MSIVKKIKDILFDVEDEIDPTPSKSSRPLKEKENAPKVKSSVLVEENKGKSINFEQVSKNEIEIKNLKRLKIVKELCLPKIILLNFQILMKKNFKICLGVNKMLIL